MTSASKVQIMVVDDDASIRDSLALVLQASGSRFLKLLDFNENGRVPLGDLPTLAATGHSADFRHRATARV